MDRVFSGAKSAHDIPIYQTTKVRFRYQSKDS